MFGLGRLGGQELLLILGVVLIVFGPSKLPEIGRAIGKGIREFRGASRDFKAGIEAEAEEPTQTNSDGGA